TAVMWESMSSPFFSEPCLKRQGFFLYWIDVFALRARFVAFSFAQSGIALKSFENPVSNETGFFVL
ncbi:hypothetical protein, partial [Flavobacterium sp.]|uniref:hypothetical protein n=1 Tax=Flavobacterium sp. TaxID=239 RepID=UPI0035B257ED